MALFSFLFVAFNFFLINSTAYVFPKVQKLSSTLNSVQVDTKINIPEQIFKSDPKKPVKNPKEPEKEGWERFMAALEDAKKNPDKPKIPPIYKPGPYPYRLLAALAYVVPIVDASDLGKYMFEAYPETQVLYNTLFGSLSAVYNGVPFLPFAVFFLMSYICRAPTFPVEIRFHFSQAFMLAIIQFVPSLLFGLLEKVGVPGMAIPYNTGLLNKLYYLSRIIKLSSYFYFFS